MIFAKRLHAPRSSTTLVNVKDIEQHLCCDTLDAIVARLAAHTLQRQPPWIAVRCGYFGLRFMQFSQVRHNSVLRLLPI